LTLARADVLRKLLQDGLDHQPLPRTDRLTARLLLHDLALITAELRTAAGEIGATLQTIRDDLAWADKAGERSVQDRPESVGPPRG
jgi:hypothetical protein